jgi:hypothetical protein
MPVGSGNNCKVALAIGLSADEAERSALSKLPGSVGEKGCEVLKGPSEAEYLVLSKLPDVSEKDCEVGLLKGPSEAEYLALSKLPRASRSVGGEKDREVGLLKGPSEAEYLALSTLPRVS